MIWKEGNLNVGLFRGSFIRCQNRTFTLGEDGIFAEIQLNPKEAKILSTKRLFTAREAWTPPVIHRGLLYITQNSKGMGGSKKRLICYDFRALE